MELPVTRLRGNLQTQKICPLEEIIAEMQCAELRKNVLEFREDLTNSLPYSAPFSLDKIPVALFAAAFRKKNGIQYFQSYTGLVLLEIKNLPDKKERKWLLQKASQPPQTVAVFTGSGGKSLKILVRFAYPDGKLPSTKEDATIFHQVAYHKAALYYSQLLEWEIDAKEPLLERRCRLSYDPELYFNPHAVPVLMEQPMGEEHDFSYAEFFRREPNPYQRMEYGFERSSLINRLFENCWQEAMVFTGWNRHEPDMGPFLARLVENCFSSGLPEEEVLRWSWIHLSSTSYTEDELRSFIVNIYRTKKGFGEKPCRATEERLVEQMDDFMKRRYTLRYNILREAVEYRDNRSFYFTFHPMQDRDYNTITRNMHQEGIAVWDRDLKRYIQSDRVPKYNPVEHFLESLPAWDGQDYIRRMARRVPTGSPEWENRFYRWFLGMVAQWKQIQGIHANSTLPLLVGDQGCGKSTFCRLLLPPSLQEYYTDSIDFANKRNAESILTHFLLINIDEFDSVPANQQSYLKNILQKPVINIKRPYQKAYLSYPRFASFIATCNNFDLLTDPTGSRRFICIEINGRIDYVTPVNYEQLYAQALHALKSGERYWYTPEEEKQTTQANAAFEVQTVEEQLFHQYFRPGDQQTGQWYSSIQILHLLEKYSRRKIGNRSAVAFGRILRKNKIQVKHTERGNVYFVAERS